MWRVPVRQFGIKANRGGPPDFGGDPSWISAESGWRIVPVYPLAPLPVAPGICLFNRLASLDPSQSRGFGPLPLTAPRVAWVSETYAYSLGQKLLKTMAIKAAAAGGGPAKRAFFCERDGHQSRRGRRMSFMISVHPFFPLIQNNHLQGYETEKSPEKTEDFDSVPGAGVEPAQPRGHWCLRPARLPIPPSGPLSATPVRLYGR